MKTSGPRMDQWPECDNEPWGFTQHGEQLDSNS